MNIHNNARLTAWGRAELVRRVVLDGEPVRAVAAALHISPSTAYKWLRRFAAGGWAALADRSSRPHRSPTATRPALIERILRLRATRLTGPEIAERLGLAVSTVGRVLTRAGQGRLKGPGATGGPRCQRETPGELVHVDTKALDRFVTAGHRAHGNRSKVGRRRGLGQDHLHVAVDDATRLAYAALLPTQDAAACTRFLEAARRWFAQLGIAVTGVMTDNAKAYTSHAVQAALAAHGIRHLRTKPYRPQTNGKAERFIQTALRRWAYKKPYRTSAHRNAALPDFLDCYNVERPHRSLGRVPPLLHFLMQREQRP
ncbi:IS481 family transposase [Pseudogemmatithrix spongiicola]|uniref:IS481 family transposase n=1 Tax=Pseudogemmatithrix spongiicola TaxID=3062599 RepID=A0AA49JSJ9_9BACT|nr:IS481 family transposase [Gemmatimonadaceae bacterium 'strain 138']WKW14060.1 IS481 family transposase [Gemmatimonadaceae bacterium 'strain 318']